MIRIVTTIKARPAVAGTQLQQLPLVPASGRLRIDTEDGEAGRQTKYTLTARLRQPVPRELLLDDLVLRVEFTDNGLLFIGTEDIPVRLRISEDDSLDISAEHVIGAL